MAGIRNSLSGTNSKAAAQPTGAAADGAVAPLAAFPLGLCPGNIPHLIRSSGPDSCRDALRVAETAAELQRTVPGGNVAAYTYDLSTLAATRRLATAVLRDWEVVDVLVNNAAVFEPFTR